MMVKYDKEVDILFIRLSEKFIKESDQDKPGIIMDYADDGSIVSIEILEASRRLLFPNKIEYEVT